MRTIHLEMKVILKTVIAAVVIGWSVQAAATDFALENNLLTVTNASPAENLTVNADGMVTAPLTIPIGAEGYGMPSFSFGLNASDIVTGEHIFWATVLITGNNNDKYLRAFLDEVFITVEENGTFSGEIKAATNLTVRVESEGEFLQIELDDQAGESVAFSGQSLQFDASNLLELLGAADGQSALWQGLAEDFTTADNYTYQIYLGPRSYGVQGARVGISNAEGFQAFPLRSASFLDNEEGYVIEGGFSTSAASQPPAGDPGAIQNSLNQIDLSGNTVSEQALTELDSVVGAAITMAADMASDLGTGSAGNSSAIEVLTTVGNVLQASATASAKTSNTELARATRVRGIALAADTAAVLDAMNLSASGAGTALTGVQMNTVQQAVTDMLAAADDLAQGNSGTDQKSLLTQSIGLMLTSQVDLGAALTQEQIALARAIADAAATGDPDNSSEQLMANYAIHIKPRNTMALTLGEAEQALLAAGGSTANAAELVAQLQATLNSNALHFQDSNGVALSVTGFADRVLAASVAADPEVTTEVTIDESTGTMSFTANSNGAESLRIPARALSASLAPASMPDGLSARADGSVVLTDSRVAVHIAPASYNPVALFAGVRDRGEVNLGEDDGNITIDEGVGTDFRFSGTFDYGGTVSTGNTVARASLESPTEGSDAANLNYRFTITYPDGTQQGISPFVEADAFYTSLRDFGLTVGTNRNTGVISIDTGDNVVTFRPSYFIEPQTNSMFEFWQNNADQHGIAYLPTDWNQDGRTDVAIITQSGFQIVYGL